MLENVKCSKLVLTSLKPSDSQLKATFLSTGLCVNPFKAPGLCQTRHLLSWVATLKLNKCVIC